MMIMFTRLVVIAITATVCAGTYGILPNSLSANNPGLNYRRFPRDAKAAQRDVFLDNLVNNLTVPELGMRNEHILPSS